MRVWTWNWQQTGDVNELLVSCDGFLVALLDNLDCEDDQVWAERAAFITDACNAAEQREAEMQATINAGRLLAHLDDVPCAFCGGSHNYRETHMAVR